MKHPDIGSEGAWQKVAAELRESERPEVEKLAHAFGWITELIIEQGLKDIELARALRDEESVVKAQIKTEVIRHARAIFRDCHLLATGRKAWDE
jgi:hypothetical protein